jgi:hypothetical protein
MKHCDSRYWIGAEGLPSRVQFKKEKREHRKHRWFSVRGSQREVSGRTNIVV